MLKVLAGRPKDIEDVAGLLRAARRMISALLLSFALHAGSLDDQAWAQTDAQKQNDSVAWIGVGAAVWAPIGGVAGGLTGWSMERNGMSSAIGVAATVGAVAGLVTGALFGFGAHKGFLPAKLAVIVPLCVELAVGAFAFYMVTRVSP